VPTTSNGTRYSVDGPEGAPVLVLVHGLGLTRQTWDDLIPTLSARYRTLAYDLFGHGQSAPAPTTPDLSVFGDQLLALLDEVEVDRATIVGFSLGGMINRRFAIDHPDRTEALVILNSPHERGEDAQRLSERHAASSAAGGPGATIDAALQRWFTADFQSRQPDVVEAVRQTVLANDPTIYAQNRWVLANGVVELIRPEPALTLPTLVMTSELDSGSTPAMCREIAAEIQGAQSFILPELRHLGLLEDPAAFTEPILRFLDDVFGTV
jgi:pimeloyl-ACP methyl ester carboxylesterase